MAKVELSRADYIQPRQGKHIRRLVWSRLLAHLYLMKYEGVDYKGEGGIVTRDLELTQGKPLAGASWRDVIRRERAKMERGME